MVAERSTFEKIVRFVCSYLKATSLRMRMGGESLSTSGNFSVMSVSF